MTGTPGPDPRWLYRLRIAATVLFWIVVVVLAHRLVHAYPQHIAEILASPLQRITVTVLLPGALVLLVARSLPFLPRPGLRSAGLVLLWSSLLVVGHALSHMGFHDARALLDAVRGDFGLLALVALALAYACALALPFVPGLELGLLIMAVFGPAGAVVAYAATVGGLMLAFAAGRALPETVVIGWLARLGVAVPRAGLAAAMQGLLAGERTQRSGPRRWAAALLGQRRLSLALCLNFPGNAALGGGGGLALLCGSSRQFGWRGFGLTVAVATSALPILVLAGWLDLEPLMQHHGFLHDALTWIERLVVHE